METYQVVLKGILPLLQGRKDPRGDPPGGKAKNQWYDDQWRYTHYADADGNLYQPFHVVKAMLVKAMRATAKSGDSEKGKGVTEQRARASLRISPIMIPFGIQVPTDGQVQILDPMAAWSLSPDDAPRPFVLRRLCARGVEISQLAINAWTLEFDLIDTSDGFFDAAWLREGLEYGGAYIGMGTWRPDFGLSQVQTFEKQA